MSRFLEPALPSARLARVFVADTLSAWDIELGSAELVASELAANAIVHARTPFTITISEHFEGIQLTVEDGDQRLPRRPAAAAWATGGRGLQLVDALSESWGIEQTEDGKTVWAVLGRSDGLAGAQLT